MNTPALEVGAVDPFTDTIVIDGTKYSAEIFRKMGGAFKPGTLLKLMSREDGVVWVRQLNGDVAGLAEELLDQAEAAGKVVTIELAPHQPLAMGNYEARVNIWPKVQRP